MPYMTALKPALIRFGLGPYLEEVPGWETRGSSSFAPACTIGHHTAGPLAGDRPSLNICVNGRTGLPGPLCNDFLSRSKVILVAAGRPNHAGAGGFRGLVGNSAAFGNEAESNGVGRKDGSPDWTEFQRWAFPRVHAAHLWVLGRDSSWYCGHRDWTDRKIDPTDVDTLALRREIDAILANPQEDDMYTETDRQIMGEIRAQLTGSSKPNEYPGLPADLVTNGKPRTVVQALGDLGRGMQAIYDTLTPGQTGVKFNGDVWAKVSDTHALVIAVEALLRQSDLNGADIDLTTLAADITAGVTANITSQLLAQVGDVVRDALGADNKDQADKIVAALGLRLVA